MAEISKFNNVREKPLVFISPLDWGLGHTTRCIPVIQELINLNCDILIACNSQQKALLQAEFPSLNYQMLPGYNLRYGGNKALTLVSLLLQVPKILIQVKRENRLLRGLLAQYPVDAIISDNRFGLSVAGIPSVFITHQLFVKTGLGNIANRMVQWFNYRYINRFHVCWVPDYAGTDAIAGQLSNPVKRPDIPVHYLGILSRFKLCTEINNRNELLIILSGPEPQRTILENKIINGLQEHPMKAVLVRGLPGNQELIAAPPGLTVYNHVTAATLNQLICEAGIVISRTGYTTVMDLLKCNKKCILIPTPGQAEQEYLARYLSGKHLAYTISQKKFSLKKSLDACSRFPFEQKQYDMEYYKIIIRDFVATLQHTADNAQSLTNT